MSHGGGTDDRFMSEINVTPFVDVMLVLLIIFMVTAPMMMQGMDVDLPEATNEPLPSQDDALIVSVDKDGQVFIGDYKVAVDAMGQKLLTMLEGQEGRDVFMNADKSVPYGIVIRVMSEIKAAGIENIGMVTVPGDQDSADRSKEAEAVQ